ncbi:MAG TPA: DUF4386 domain-containing protein [Coriobacteriia bacterium]|nr:DUF4386 domain-containing protein [Coriobacteriia bacterium]
MSLDFALEENRGRLARLTGGVYLLYIVTMVLADVFGKIGRSTAQELAAAVALGDLSFRTGLVFSLVSGLLFALVAWGLYVLLRPVNRDLALLFLFLNGIGVAMHCLAALPLISTMLQTDAATQMQVFSAAQLTALGLLSANTYKIAFVTSQLFFGTWLFPLGYLAYKSGFLPKVIGLLLLADGVGVMIWFVQALMFPAYPAVRVPGLIVSFVAEFGLALWLLVMGVKPAPPKTVLVPQTN